MSTAELEKKLKGYERDIKKLQNRLKELELDKNSAEDREKNLNIQKKRLEQDIRDLKFELDSSKNRPSSSFDIEGMKKDQELLRKQLEEKILLLSGIETDKAKLEMQFIELSRKNKELRENLEGEKAKFTQSEKQKVILDKEITQLENQLEDEFTERSRWEKDKRDLTFLVEQLKIDKETATRMRARVEEERKQLEKEIDKLKKKNKQMLEESKSSEAQVLTDMLAKETTAKVKAEQEMEALRAETEIYRKKNRELQFSVDDLSKQVGEHKIYLEGEQRARAKAEEAAKAALEQAKQADESLERLKEDLLQGDVSLKKSVVILTEQVEYHKQQESKSQGEKLELHRKIQGLQGQLYDLEAQMRKQDRQLEELRGSSVGDLSNEVAALRKKLTKVENEKYDLEDQLRQQTNKWVNENDMRIKLEKQRKKQNLIIRELKKKLAIADGEELAKALANITDPRAIRSEMLTEVKQLLETVRQEVAKRQQSEEVAEKLRDELLQLKLQFGIIKDSRAIDDEKEKVDDPVEVSEAKKKFELMVSYLCDIRYPTDEDFIDDGNGMTDIFVVEGPVEFPLPNKEHGQFFSANCYVVHYQGLVSEREVVYVWNGRDSSADDRKSADEHGKKMLDRLKTPGKLVKLQEGKETKHFMSIFKGKMIIYHGRKADFDPSLNIMFMIIGSEPSNGQIVECGFEAAMLNSLHSSVIQTPNVVYAWAGEHSTDFERDVAADLVSKIQGDRSLMNIMQGSENEDFWNDLGGEDVFMTGEDFDGDWKPKFFQCFPIDRDELQIKEVFSWTQDDLIPDHLVMLDVGKEIYIWLGADAPQKDAAKKKLMDLALEYSRREQDSRPVNTKVIYLKQNNESPKFTRFFRGWIKNFWDDRKYLKKAEADAAAAAAEKSLEEVMNEYKKTFTYEQLKDRASLPAHVDQNKLEDYLNEAEFPAVFGMTKEQFSKCQAWKVNKLKRQKGLF